MFSPTLRNPMDQSTPGPPIFHCLPEFGQIHIGNFNDTVQPPRPLSPPSLALTLSQHQRLSVDSFCGHLASVTRHGTLLPSHRGGTYLSTNIFTCFKTVKLAGAGISDGPYNNLTTFGLPTLQHRFLWFNPLHWLKFNLAPEIIILNKYRRLGGGGSFYSQIHHCFAIARIRTSSNFFTIKSYTSKIPKDFPRAKGSPGVHWKPKGGKMML